MHFQGEFRVYDDTRQSICCPSYLHFERFFTSLNSPPHPSWQARIGWGLWQRERERERERREETSVKHARRPRSLNQVAFRHRRCATQSNMRSEARKIGHSLFKDGLELLHVAVRQHIVVQRPESMNWKMRTDCMHFPFTF